MTATTWEAAQKRLVSAAQKVDRARNDLRAEVQNARRLGVSWERIGDALGISRQAAFKRFR